MLGIFGDAGRFQSLTGQYSHVGHVIQGWDQGYSWGTRFSALLPQYGPMPMIGLGTGTGWPDPERRSRRVGSPWARATAT
jgi:hypothetical protein